MDSNASQHHTYTDRASASHLDLDDEAELLRRAQTGDADAQSVIYRCYAPALLRFARRRVLREAEDVVQETFIAAFRGRPFRGESKVMTYLRAIAIRQITRANRRYAPWSSDETSTIISESSRLLSEGDLFAAENVRAALSRLPPRFRDVLIVHIVHEHSCRESAIALDLPLGTFKSRLAAAKNAFRRELSRRGFSAT